eukprot:SAG31_NODE_1007_length_10425_cov_4.852799_4_plen_213_part_00
MGEDGDDLPDVRWFAGTRGVSQSCDELCASIEECGTADDPAPCPEPPTCIKGWLEQAWTESACALLQTARQEAGVVAWTSCSLCAPPDYCQSSSCMFCAPGVLETQAPTTAYRGTSVASPDVCANQYLDDRCDAPNSKPAHQLPVISNSSGVPPVFEFGTAQDTASLPVLLAAAAPEHRLDNQCMHRWRARCLLAWRLGMRTLRGEGEEVAA